MKLAHYKVPYRPTYNSNSVFFNTFLAKPGLSPLALGESGVFPFCNQREALPGECSIASLKKKTGLQLSDDQLSSWLSS